MQLLLPFNTNFLIAKWFTNFTKYTYFVTQENVSLQGYMFRITGGNDKQGFPMKQGVLSNGRVRLLLSKGHSCYRPRREGERRRKSVRGCIVDANLSVLSLVIIKKGKLLFFWGGGSSSLSAKHRSTPAACHHNDDCINVVNKKLGEEKNSLIKTLRN